MKKIQIEIKKVITYCLVLGILMGNAGVFGEIQATDKIQKADKANKSTFIDEKSSYRNYYSTHREASSPADEIIIDLEKYRTDNLKDTALVVIDNIKGKVIKTGDTGYVEWDFEVLREGLYNIAIEYLPIEGKGSSIVREIQINGKLPFDEAGTITFSRTFTNDGNIKTDLMGNQIRPSQIEKPIWMKRDFSDSLGYYNEPLKFYFQNGKNTLKLISIREPVVIKSLKIYQTATIPKYEEKKEEYKQKNYTKTFDQEIVIEGENASLKSDRILYPINDNSSPLTSPSSFNKKLINSIGGQKWQTPGQWLEWEFNAKEAGLYRLGIKSRQNTLAGKPSYRRIYINDKIYSDSMKIVKFPFDSQWRMNIIGGKENPESVYLQAGNNKIRIEAVVGELDELVQKVNASLSNLNAIYLELLMLVGPSPDIYRDYMFEKRLPETIKKIKEQSIILNECYTEFKRINGQEGPYSQQLKNFSNQLKKMNEKPETIASNFGDFVNNISSLGTWITTILSQPLEIDYIAFASENIPVEKVSAGVFQQLSYMFKQFLFSFFINYNSIGAMSKDASNLTVWMSSGRDQGNALNQLIINDFTANKDIIVKLELVPAGTLLPATLAGKGPDIALNNGQSDPLNYAIRGAVVDLKEFSDYNEVAKRFQKSALEPLEFRESVYGIPETQSFPMLFYRKDVLNMLGLDVPKTWDDVISMLPILQKSNLNFGLPQPYIGNLTGAGFSSYAMFLFQQGGTIYKNDGEMALLDSNEAINSFFTWINFYNEYSLPVSYDFVSRFRTGEIPIGIADYSIYNVLSVFAPELNGIWSFDQVPGTIRKDGSIDRSVASVITATAMMQNVKNKADAWQFIKWWTSSDIQNKYGNEVESIMGTAGRYQTANIDAFYNMPWSSKDFQMLTKQWQSTKGIREVPGSYMTPRYIDFAFKQAFIGTTTKTNSALIDPGEIIQNATRLINEEIREKRNEFGLDK